MVTTQDVSDWLYAEDPQALRRMGAPPDEYDSEAEAIVARLAILETPWRGEAVLALVHQVFVEQFDPTLSGPRDAYAPIAARILRAGRVTGETEPLRLPDTGILEP